jgi:hypothetical protein
MLTHRRLSGAAAIGLTAVLTGALAAPSFAAPTDDPADPTPTESAEPAPSETAEPTEPAPSESDEPGNGDEPGDEDEPGNGDEDEDDPKTFSDNPEGSAFYTPVQWMADAEISVGYADGTFKKNRNVTRGETTAFLFRYIEPEEFEAPDESPFSDVNAGGAFFDPITFAADEEITVGYADGTFKPSKSVTRGQFAAFLYRWAEPEHTAPTTSPFEDLTKGGANYDAITWLAAEGITVGDTEGNFNQSDSITRGQISAFMQRYDAFIG